MDASEIIVGETRIFTAHFQSAYSLPDKILPNEVARFLVRGERYAEIQAAQFHQSLRGLIAEQVNKSKSNWTDAQENPPLQSG